MWLRTTPDEPRRVNWLSARLHIPSHARGYGNHRQGWSQETSRDKGPDRS